MGATVRVGTVVTETTSDGSFAPYGIPQGAQLLSVDGSTAAADGGSYPLFSIHLEVEPDSETIIERPIYLPFISAEDAVMVEPDANTEVMNTTDPKLKEAMVAVLWDTARQNGESYTGALSITRVPVDRTPRSLPPELNPSILITMQPAGVDLAIPAPVTLPNLDGHAPGAILNLWSLDHETGKFFVAGLGKVSPDGKTIETIQGGVRGSSWHFFVVSIAGSGFIPEDLTPEEVEALKDLAFNLGLVAAGLVLPATWPAFIGLALVATAREIHDAGTTIGETKVMGDFSFENITAKERQDIGFNVALGLLAKGIAVNAPKGSYLSLADKVHTAIGTSIVVVKADAARMRGNAQRLEERVQANPTLILASGRTLKTTIDPIIASLEQGAVLIEGTIPKLLRAQDQARAIEDNARKLIAWGNLNTTQEQLEEIDALMLELEALIKSHQEAGNPFAFLAEALEEAQALIEEALDEVSRPVVQGQVLLNCGGKTISTQTKPDGSYVLAGNIPQATACTLLMLDTENRAFSKAGVSLEESTALSSVDLVVSQPLEEAAFGEGNEGRLEQDGDIDVYVLEGRAGDRIGVGLGALQGTEAGVSVRLRLLDPQGKEVAEDSSGCFGSIYCFLFRPELKDVVLPQDGLYSLLVEGGNTGVADSTYVLNVSPNLTAVESLPRIGFGEGIEGRLENSGETDVYVLEGRTGDRIRVGLGALQGTEAGVSVRLRLLHPQGKEVAEDSTSCFGSIYCFLFLPELKDVVLPQDGLYSLLVEGGNIGVASSTYVLNVSPNLTATVESLPRIVLGIVPKQPPVREWWHGTEDWVPSMSTRQELEHSAR